jgi:hypothetical protein
VPAKFGTKACWDSPRTTVDSGLGGSRGFGCAAIQPGGVSTSEAGHELDGGDGLRKRRSRLALPDATSPGGCLAAGIMALPCVPQLTQINAHPLQTGQIWSDTTRVIGP